MHERPRIVGTVPAEVIGIESAPIQMNEVTVLESALQLFDRFGPSFIGHHLMPGAEGLPRPGWAPNWEHLLYEVVYGQIAEYLCVVPLEVCDTLQRTIASKGKPFFDHFRNEEIDPWECEASPVGRASELYAFARMSVKIGIWPVVRTEAEWSAIEVTEQPLSADSTAAKDLTKEIGVLGKTNSGLTAYDMTSFQKAKRKRVEDWSNQSEIRGLPLKEFLRFHHNWRNAMIDPYMKARSRVLHLIQTMGWTVEEYHEREKEQRNEQHKEMLETFKKSIRVRTSKDPHGSMYVPGWPDRCPECEGFLIVSSSVDEFLEVYPDAGKKSAEEEADPGSTRVMRCPLQECQAFFVEVEFDDATNESAPNFSIALSIADERERLGIPKSMPWEPASITQEEADRGNPQPW